ncbi:UPF0496 protein At5g66675-like [Typha angustifolia]|uniref:UPF0496 protein At5g66675-like n=1 Tax=Typha angustifolia TaxID=59011 RepID=UPI003C306B3D
MGCSCSKGEDATAPFAARTELTALCKELESRLASEASPNSTGLAAILQPEITEVVLKNSKTSSLVIDFFNHNMFATLGYLGELKQCLEKGRRYQETLRHVIRCFDRENKTKKSNNKKYKKKKKKYSATVAKLKASENGGNLFDGMDVEKLQEVYDRQQLLLRDLLKRKREIKKKLSSSKKWRKVFNVAYMIAFIAVLTGSVALAAVAAPTAATTAATVAATAMKAVEPWFITSWDEQNGELENEKEVVKTMRQGSTAAVHELESIRSLVQKLRNDVNSMRKSVEFAIGGGEEDEAVAVELGVAEIRRKMEDVQKGMDELQEKMEWCEGQFRKAAGEFLKSLTNET